MAVLRYSHQHSGALGLNVGKLLPSISPVLNKHHWSDQYKGQAFWRAKACQTPVVILLSACKLPYRGTFPSQYAPTPSVQKRLNQLCCTARVDPYWDSTISRLTNTPSCAQSSLPPHSLHMLPTCYPATLFLSSAFTVHATLPEGWHVS